VVVIAKRTKALIDKLYESYYMYQLYMIKSVGDVVEKGFIADSTVA